MRHLDWWFVDVETTALASFEEGAVVVSIDGGTLPEIRESYSGAWYTSS